MAGTTGRPGAVPPPPNNLQDFHTLHFLGTIWIFANNSKQNNSKQISSVFR